MSQNPNHLAPDSPSADRVSTAIIHSEATDDPNYPRFHVAPPIGRLNDPNGLVQVGDTYHAFFQLTPFFPEEKATYWGHASSKDLANWTPHEPAIAPDHWYDRCGAYSGGATISDGTVWMHYTGNVKTADGTRESYQCAATTTDFQEFTKVAQNPLLSGPPPGYTAHIRDPFIVPEESGFTMYLGAQREDLTGCILTYRSDDLQEWKLVGELEVADPIYKDFGYMWECPNLFAVQDKDTGEEFDVLLFSPQGISPQDFQFRNIFACGYILGHLDGNRFTPTSEFIELDAGFEFYAPQIFTYDSAHTSKDPLLLGWVGNASEDNQPSLQEYGWVHALSSARSLTLQNNRLHQHPVFHLPEAARSVLTPRTLAEDLRPIGELDGNRSFIMILHMEQRGPWQMLLGKDNGPRVTFDFDADQLHVSRAHTYYPHGNSRTVPIPNKEILQVTLVHDRSVTEVFVDDGALAFSMRSYLDASDFQVLLQGAASIQSGTITVL